MPIRDFVRGVRNKVHRRKVDTGASDGDSESSTPINSSRTSIRGSSRPSLLSGTSNGPPAAVQMPVPMFNHSQHLSGAVPGPSHSATPVTTSPHAGPMDGALAELTAVSATLNDGAPVRRADRILDSLGDVVEDNAPYTNMAKSIFDNVSQAATELGQTDIGEKIESSIERFADNIPWLLNALDQVATIHPALKVAVLAFKAVYELERTRQENDRRVKTLYVEMKDMMLVMVQLRGIESRTHIGPDGRTVLGDPLKELAELTAKNIKDCANFCDIFLKKHTLVKVLKGPVWAEKLASFVQVFSDRKADFHFALAIHTANSATDVKRQNYDIQAKLNEVIGMFGRLVSQEEQMIDAEVKRRGVPNRVADMDDSMLQSLITIQLSVRKAGQESKGDSQDAKLAPEEQLGMLPHGTRTAQLMTEKAISLDELKTELRESVDDAMERNSGTFIRKFELQVSALQLAIEEYVRTDNDRVIGAVKDAMVQGPHSKINNPELRKIWQDMGWRGHVKARIFVMTLQDHYREVFEHSVVGPDNAGPVTSDEWALQFLSVAWLEPIIDAFDDDASGYVTVAEVNCLMDMRPPELKWSVPHWLAYWAIGRKVAASMYATRIITLLSLMRDAVPKVLPRNRSAVDDLFGDLWTGIVMIISGLHPPSEVERNTPILRFQEYIDMEETRLRRNLQKVRYNVDASDTLAVVIGKDGIESSILPLIYLLLENDWKKMQAAQSVVLSRREFAKSYGNMMRVMGAIRRRIEELAALYLQRRIAPAEQFARHAYGLFYFLHPDSKAFWDIRQSHNPLYTYVAITPAKNGPPDIEGMDLETQPLGDVSMYKSSYDEVTEEVLKNTPQLLRSIVGSWKGRKAVSAVSADDSDQVYRTFTTVNTWITFWCTEERPASDVTEDFRASVQGFELDSPVISSMRGGIVGTVGARSSKDGIVQSRVSWTSSDSTTGRKAFHRGLFVDERHIEGMWSYDSSLPESRRWPFMLRKEDPDLPHSIQPTSLALRPRNNYRELWKYAIDATLYSVRRKLWTWTYFDMRRKARKEIIRNIFDKHDGRSRDPHREMTLVTGNDSTFFVKLAYSLAHTIPVHQHRCWNPESSGTPHAIRGARYICIDCPESLVEPFWLQVTFCDREQCYKRDVVPGAVPPWTHYYATHAFIKIRTIVHHLAWPSLRDKAVAAKNTLPWRPSPAPPTVSVPSPSASMSVPGHIDSPTPPYGGGDGEGNGKAGTRGGTQNETPEPEENSRLRQARRTVYASDVAGASSPSPYLQVCYTCAGALDTNRFWWCLDCWAPICDKCEGDTLIVCWSCAKLFPQPTWYYGLSPKTDFICNRCCAHGVKGPDPNYDGARRRHDYTHPLLLVTPWPPRDLPQQRQTEGRLARLEEQISAMDAKFEQLQAEVARIVKAQQEMQAALLAKFTERLDALTARNHGHV